MRHLRALGGLVAVGIAFATAGCSYPAPSVTVTVVPTETVTVTATPDPAPGGTGTTPADAETADTTTFVTPSIWFVWLSADDKAAVCDYVAKAGAASYNDWRQEPWPELDPADAEEFLTDACA